MTEAAGKIDAKPSFPWRKAVRALISVAIVVAIFVFAIPKFASYSAVWPILKGLSAAQIVWLLLAQFLSLLFNLCCPDWHVLPLLSGVSP